MPQYFTCEFFLNTWVNFDQQNKIDPQHPPSPACRMPKTKCKLASALQGGTGQKSQNKQTKFLNLLVLVHLKNYFIEALNKFLMCFEINGLKNLKLTILRFFAWSPQLYILLYSSKNIFIVKTAWIHIIFILMF